MSEASANQIASLLASGVGQTIVGQANVTSGTYFSYRTNENSTINVSLQQATPNFLEVDYYWQDWPAVSNEMTVNQSFSITAANVRASYLLQTMGIAYSNISFADQISTLTPSDYVVQRVQSYDNVPFLGTLTQNPDGTYYFSSSQVYFDFNPSNGSLNVAIIDGPYWYNIPSNFSQKVQPTQATVIAEDYALHSLGVNQISDSEVQFAVIQNHLYYAVTVTDYNTSYTVFVDPNNGSVGFP
jgi:hypothetical protein